MHLIDARSWCHLSAHKFWKCSVVLLFLLLLFLVMRPKSVYLRRDLKHQLLSLLTNSNMAIWWGYNKVLIHPVVGQVRSSGHDQYIDIWGNGILTPTSWAAKQSEVLKKMVPTDFFCRKLSLKDCQISRTNELPKNGVVWTELTRKIRP